MRYSHYRDTVITCFFKQYYTKHTNTFDDSFTDFNDVAASTADTGGLVTGLYVDPDYVLNADSSLNYNSLHIVHGVVGQYENGMKETSRNDLTNIIFFFV